MWLVSLCLAADPAPSTIPEVPSPSANPSADPSANPSANAATPAPTAPPGYTIPNSRVSTTGEIREILTLPPDIVVDQLGTSTGQGFVVDQRLRVGLAAKWDYASLGTEWDLFKGQIAGDTWQIPGTEDARHRERLGVTLPESFVPRKLAATVTLAPVQVVAGLQTSHWGLGMLANDGAHDPDFGRADFGDRVLRLRMSTRLGSTSPWALIVAGDRVIEDETAAWSAGQVAWQGVGGLLYSSPARDSFGVYGVFRDQTEADGVRRTTVGVLDLYGELHLLDGADGGGLSIGAEAAGIAGVTSRSKSYNARGGLKVRSAGATGYVRGALPGDDYSLTLRGGWASGDGDPDDDQSNDFSFDRDFEVGMVLFDDVQGAIDAGAHRLLTDPQYAGQAPDGVDAVVSEGAFRRASFVMPVLAAAPLDWLGLQAGLLVAFPTAPVAHPFYSYRNGGVPTNQLGVVTTGGALGKEVDWSVKLGDRAVDLRGLALKPALLVQGGHLLPGADLGVEGPVHEVMVTARARW